MAKYYYNKYKDGSSAARLNSGAGFNLDNVPKSLKYSDPIYAYDYFKEFGGNPYYKTSIGEFLIDHKTSSFDKSIHTNIYLPVGDNLYFYQNFSFTNNYPGRIYGASGEVLASYTTTIRVALLKETIRRGDFIETVIAEEGTLPDDGFFNGFWYVKDTPANQTPTISGRDLDLGGIKQPFTHSYSIDDKDLTQELSITITKSWLSGSETIGNAIRNQNYITGINQDEFNSLELNKQHKITITVTDGAGAKYSRYISFRRINSAPVITVNRDMGEQNVPFDVTYRVTDLENDTVNVEFLHEGKVIGNQHNVDKEIDLTWSIPNLEYIKIPNGYNEITIRAIDVNGASSASLVGFTKNVHGCGIEHGIEVDKVVDFCIADCKRELAKELDEENVEILKVQACNNYGDDEPNWEDIPLGKIYRFVNKTAVNAPKVGVRFEVLSDPQIGNSYLSNFVFKWGWEE